MKRIPLRSAEGIVRAYAVVDDEDFDRLNVHRWHMAESRGNVYVRRKVAQRLVTMHRFLLGLDPHDRSIEVDHIDGDGLNNLRSNLRVTTRAGNAQNRRKYAPATSAHRGVHLCRKTGRWRAMVRTHGKAHHLGYFDVEMEAARAASDFRRQHMLYSNEEMYA